MGVSMKFTKNLSKWRFRYIFAGLLVALLVFEMNLGKKSLVKWTVLSSKTPEASIEGGIIFDKEKRDGQKHVAQVVSSVTTGSEEESLEWEIKMSTEEISEENPFAEDENEEVKKTRAVIEMEASGCTNCEKTITFVKGEDFEEFSDLKKLIEKEILENATKNFTDNHEETNEPKSSLAKNETECSQHYEGDYLNTFICEGNEVKSLIRERVSENKMREHILRNVLPYLDVVFGNYEKQDQKALSSLTRGLGSARYRSARSASWAVDTLAKVKDRYENLEESYYNQENEFGKTAVMSQISNLKLQADTSYMNLLSVNEMDMYNLVKHISDRNIFTLLKRDRVNRDAEMLVEETSHTKTPSAKDNDDPVENVKLDNEEDSFSKELNAAFNPNEDALNKSKEKIEGEILPKGKQPAPFRRGVREVKETINFQPFN